MTLLLGCAYNLIQLLFTEGRTTRIIYVDGSLHFFSIIQHVDCCIRAVLSIIKCFVHSSILKNCFFAHICPMKIVLFHSYQFKHPAYYPGPVESRDTYSL